MLKWNVLKRTSVVLFTLLFINNIISKVSGQNQPDRNILPLANEIEQLKKDAGLKSASWSICVMEVKTGEVLAGYNQDIVLEPASLMKILSTGSALALLGTNYRFATKLEYSGILDTTTGVLHGNLYLTGGGDPTLGSSRFGEKVCIDSVFKSFYNDLKRKNIVRIEGQLIADASVFDDNPAVYSWLWEDIGNYYASGAYGINIFENSYRIFFDAGSKIGERARIVRVEPDDTDITFINRVTTASSNTGDNVVILGSPYTYTRILEGTVPLGKTNFDVDGSLPDPPAYTLKLFEKFLETQGLQIKGESTSIRELEWKGINDTLKRKTLSVYYSPALKDIVIHTNLRSINLFAESMLKMMGRLKFGRGTTEAGADAVYEYLMLKKINTSGLYIADACGLSRKNKISTKQMCDILRMYKNEVFFDDFNKSLPVAGKSGGMASLLKGTIAENNLRAKTGNMEKIKSYAGYVTNAAGKELAFAIIFNNYTSSNSVIKQKVEKLMLLISQTK